LGELGKIAAVHHVPRHERVSEIDRAAFATEPEIGDLVGSDASIDSIEFMPELQRIGAALGSQLRLEHFLGFLS
jgi:hypothetical protein